MNAKEAYTLAQKKKISVEEAIKIYTREVNGIIQRAAESAKFSVEIQLPVRVNVVHVGFPTAPIPDWDKSPIKDSVVQSLEDNGFKVSLSDSLMKVSWELEDGNS